MSADELFDSAYALHAAGDLAKAGEIYRRILVERPEDAEVLQLLGVLCLQRGEKKEAREFLERSLKIEPAAPDCHYHLGIMQADAGDHAGAARSFEAAVQLQPEFVEALGRWGVSLQAMGKWDEAIEVHQRAVIFRGDSLDDYLQLGNAQCGAGKLEEAAATFQKVLDLNPRSYAAAYSLGFVLRKIDCWDEAIAAYRQALEFKWGDVAASNNLAAALKDTGRLDEALECINQAIGGEPENAAVASNRLFMLHFHPAYDAASLLEEHVQWNEKYAKSLAGEIRVHANDRSPGRRLRIGYVSADFRQHPVGLAIEPVLRNHDRRQFEIFCYSNSTTDDAVTRRIRGVADHWQVIAGMTDEKVADLIRENQIDILVDLSLHMALNRMLVFARKPAPVQVTYLGYPGTTGLGTMDYRLSDPWLDPPGTDGFYTEKTIRLPRTYLCWKWAGGGEPVGELPAGERRQITFGSLNNFCKVTPVVLQTWGELLARLPDSRLLLRTPPGETARRARRILSDFGVSEERVLVSGRLPWVDYVQLCGQVDIGLDPFPYPGHTTSLDLMWMGAPVVTLSGPTAASRGGVSILQNLGLPELIAGSEREYISIAEKLAGDLGRLKEIRKSMRERIKGSALRDEKGFAGEIEGAFRQMWENWCAGETR
ncbi:MAG: tetratricopeptide repeat protein [Tepidisphaeraceae bacterium]